MRWPEIHVNRTSIFDITIELVEEAQTYQEEIITSSPQFMNARCQKTRAWATTPMHKRKSGESGTGGELSRKVYGTRRK
jgi:transcriptional regulator with PAS, ATPase and Fis domain